MLDTDILRSGGSNAAPYAEKRDRSAPPSALDGFVTGLIARSSGMAGIGHRPLAALADRVLAEADRLADIAEIDFADAVTRCRARLMIDGLSDDNVVEAFALTREATHRVMGFCHHRVQVIGGLAMLAGRLAEMETGEGKTITAMLPAAAAALAGTPVHVVTVNDYLADRDACELRPVYALLGLSVGLVAEGLEPDERRGAYRCDVTYCTNKDLVFDYLRDQLSTGQKRGAARRLLRSLRGRGAAATICCCADSTSRSSMRPTAC
ncbi:hypothetical protein [Sphingomonas sp. MMS24-J13]|uniref:hypothetical protein n=1 Tax=Sphingomonas sp. MMS24-J13 TaxID=3238686 RepID=UPI00384AB4B8